MKKKLVFPLYSIISFAFVLLFSGFLIAAYLLEGKNIFFYTGFTQFTIDELFFLMLFVRCGLFVSSVIVFLHKNMPKKFLKIIVSIIVAVVSCIIFLNSLVLLAFRPTSYVEIVSDDGEHSIVIGEDCYPFSPHGGDIFEKTSFCTMEKIGRYTAEKDYYTPFSDGKYHVVWNEKDFELHYDFDDTGEENTVVIVKYLSEKSS